MVPSRSVLTRRRHRRGEGGIGAVAAVLLVLLAAGAYIAYALVPVWFDYLAVREVCRTTVLDWSTHENQNQARARFQSELRRKNVTDQFSEEDCRFLDNKGAWQVDCAWTQVAYYPGTNYYKSFPLRVDVIFQDGQAKDIAH